MERIENQALLGERALFGKKDACIKGCRFAEGESPLKEASDISLEESTFEWKYPLWYARRVSAKNCKWENMARAGVWYSSFVTVEDSQIIAPKNFRKCENLTLKNVHFPNAQETLWWNKEVVLEDVNAVGDYFAMGSENLTIRGLKLEGNYPFDGSKNVLIEDSTLISKDAFWNSENITMRNCYVNGEYLAWNAKNVTLENCTIDSLQGLCYIENLTIRGCRLKGCSLAFEYVSGLDAEIEDSIESIINPISGRVSVPSIGKLILETDKIDPEKTVIDCPIIEKTYDHNIYEGMRIVPAERS